MKKKTTVLLALISMCLIVTAGIGAVSASDETPSAVIPVFKINPDGTTTVVETIEGSGPTVVTVTPNEDGSINITREDRQISEEEKIDDSASILCYKTTIIPSFRAYARCYAFSQRTGAESTSDETHGVVIPVFKINPDGTTTVVETIEGSGPTVVTVTPNEDGSINITREDRQISEEEKIDDSASTLCYKATAWNYHIGWGCYAASSDDDLGTGAEAWDGRLRCYAFTWRSGAESTSDETHGVVIPVFKINPDGTTTVVETIEGSGPTVVTVTPNEDGSINITKEDRQISEDERHHPNACKEIIITPESELPVNIVNENFSLTADVPKPSEKVDDSARTLYYRAKGENYRTGSQCCKTSYNYYKGTGAQVWDTHCSCFDIPC